MIDPKLILTIQEFYGFDGQIGVLAKVTKGSLSENHVIEISNTSYFLKKYRFAEKERVVEIHQVKSFFADRGIPVILPIQGQEGTFFEFKGEFYALFPFVSGEHIEWDNLNKQALQSCGEMLARIHLQSKGGCPHLVESRTFAWDTEKFSEKAMTILEKIEGESLHSEFSQITKPFLEKKIKLAHANTYRYEDFGIQDDHLIHGDYHEENLFFLQDRIQYVFDWEKANISPRVMELARALEFLAFYGVYTDENFKRAKIFLQSYHALYPIDSNELERGLKAWYLHQIHNLWILEEHYMKDNDRVDIFLENQVNYLEYHSKHEDEYIGQLKGYIY